MWFILLNIGNGNPHVTEKTGIMRYADKKEETISLKAQQQKSKYIKSDCYSSPKD